MPHRGPVRATPLRVGMAARALTASATLLLLVLCAASTHAHSGPAPTTPEPAPTATATVGSAAGAGAGGVLTPQAAADRITSLPGLATPLPFDMFSGYLTVNATHGRALFYWFAESAGNPATDPVLVWMQGGPGCSSLIGCVKCQWWCGCGGWGGVVWWCGGVCAVCMYVFVH